jgi:hypothetical protein
MLAGSSTAFASRRDHKRTHDRARTTVPSTGESGLPVSTIVTS